MIRSLGRLGALFFACGVLGACDPDGVAGIPVARATDEPILVRSYEQGTRYFVETRQGKNIARVGADRFWGGAIFEAELNGRNTVNVHDPMGREIQISLYDGGNVYDSCAGCRSWGWNPVQGGDRDGNNGLVLGGSLTDDGFFIRSRPNHWHPGIGGGSRGRPVRSDIVVEEWISAVPGHPFAFHIRYRIIHDGEDTHLPSYLQEFPAVYVNREFPRFIHYSGNQPWTGEPADESPLPLLNTPEVKRVYTPEWWSAFVNDAGEGLTVFTPGSFPYTVPGYFPGPTVGPEAASTGYTYAFNPFGLGPRQVLTGDVYLILGDYREARKVIYELHRNVEVLDISSPIGMVEVAGAGPGPAVRISGWAFDNVGVSSVEIYLDGQPVGRATLGQLRPQVAANWRGAPSNTGFTFLLDRRGIEAGEHEIRARATDAAGNFAEWSSGLTIGQ